MRHWRFPWPEFCLVAFLSFEKEEKNNCPFYDCLFLNNFKMMGFSGGSLDLAH